MIPEANEHEAGSGCPTPTCSALPTSLGGMMEWVKALSEKHGEEKAMKIIDCLQGVTLALKRFDEPVAIASIETLNEMFQAGKADESSSQNSELSQPEANNT